MLYWYPCMPRVFSIPAILALPMLARWKSDCVGRLRPTYIDEAPEVEHGVGWDDPEVDFAHEFLLRDAVKLDECVACCESLS